MFVHAYTVSNGAVWTHTCAVYSCTMWAHPCTVSKLYKCENTQTRDPIVQQGYQSATLYNRSKARCELPFCILDPPVCSSTRIHTSEVSELSDCTGRKHCVAMRKHGSIGRNAQPRRSKSPSSSLRAPSRCARAHACAGCWSNIPQIDHRTGRA